MVLSVDIAGAVWKEYIKNQQLPEPGDYYTVV